MISALSASTATATAARPPRRSPSMDAQLSDARAKLDDWVTCPSAKTPEGKAEIKKATAQVNTAKAQIKQADDANAQAVTAKSADDLRRSSEPPASQDAGVAQRAPSNPPAASFFGANPSLGTQVDLVA